MSERSNKNWPNGEFAQREVAQFWGWLVIPLIALVAALLLPAIKLKSKSVVILYCAQDQEYAEPLLKQFEQETGVRVKALYDNEAVKTVGLANRLLAERNHPLCDVFWGNEELRTRQLAAQNVFRETNGWTAFGYRSRRIVINTNLVAFAEPAPNPSQEGSNDGARTNASSPPGRGQGWVAPRSLLDLTNALWRGQVALAYPQFGTTGTHMNALRQLWGEARWLAWCRGLVANGTKLVDGNSVVLKLVGRGEAAIGLSDSDDILAGQREGLPVAMLPLGPESLLIPNTVGVIRSAPHAAAAEKLRQVLQRRDVVEKLVAAHALESVESPVDRTARDGLLQPDWAVILRDLDAATKQLNEEFLK
jgi:iron(III) transport system substrate-binding protein